MNGYIRVRGTFHTVKIAFVEVEVYWQIVISLVCARRMGAKKSSADSGGSANPNEEDLVEEDQATQLHQEKMSNTLWDTSLLFWCHRRYSTGLNLLCVQLGAAILIPFCFHFMKIMLLFNVVLLLWAS